MSICISVSTYKKPEALKGWLDSVHNFGNISVVHVADDNDGECQVVAEDYQKRYEEGSFPFPIFYSTGPNAGISKNKNRGIKFFLNEPQAAECKYLVLSDDDIKFKTCDLSGMVPTVGDAFIKASKNSGLKHLTGFLGGSFGKMNDDGTVSFQAEAFFEQFKPLAEDEMIYHTLGGTQGVLLFFHREIIEKLGYFALFPGKYGFEHAHYSMRANRMEGRCPELFPVLKYCPEYFGCQGIPNNYVARPEENSADYEKKRQEVYNGINLTVRNPGL